MVSVDVRDARADKKGPEMELNNVLIGLQQKGCKIIGAPLLFYSGIDKVIYSIAYDNTNMKIEKDE